MLIIIVLMTTLYSLTRYYDMSFLAYSSGDPLWRLLSAQLLHTSFIHLLFNSVAFLSFVNVIDKYINKYAAAMITLVSSSAALYLSAQLMPTQGLSAAVFALIGIVLLRMVQRDHQGWERFVVNILVVLILQCLIADNVNNMAHALSLCFSIILTLTYDYFEGHLRRKQ